MSLPNALLLIESQPLFLDGLATALSKGWPRAVLHMFASFYDARPTLEAAPVDCILANSEMLQESDVTELVQAAAPAPVLLTSHCVSDDAAAAAMRLGARGYLPKTMSGEAIRSAVIVALSGGVCLPSPPSSHTSRKHVGATRTRARRELEVLAHLGEGLSNKAIARELGVSVATVKLYVQSILRSTGASSRLEAVIKARRMGILPPEPSLTTP